MNGGRKEDFENMNHDDVQLIYIMHTATQNHLIRSMTDVISQLFGGK